MTNENPLLETCDTCCSVNYGGKKVFADALSKPIPTGTPFGDRMRIIAERLADAREQSGYIGIVEE